MDVKRLPMARRGFGTKGQKIPLIANHFTVKFASTRGFIFQYIVSVSHEDGRPLEGKGSQRTIINRVRDIYNSEFDGKHFAYDGESFFTNGPFLHKRLELTLVLKDSSSNKSNGNCSPEGNGSPEGDKKRVAYQFKRFKIKLRFAAKIPMEAIADALCGKESVNSQKALAVLDLILRQRAAKQGCLLVRQSFFCDDGNNFDNIGGGVQGCRGFHSSFRTTQGGLSLNIDVTTTMTVKPGPLADFLLENQNVQDLISVDWGRAKRSLKNLRVKVKPSNQEYKITGLSEQSCKDQLFLMKQKNGKESGELETIEITVYEYFVRHRRIDLHSSGNVPCINVGKRKRPTYIPLELCELVPLQRYAKSPNYLQRVALVEKSRQDPQERRNAIMNAMKTSNYDTEPVLRSFGISIDTNFNEVVGRVLTTPELRCGNDKNFFPKNGRWNFNNKKLLEPTKIARWVVVNFSTQCDMQGLVSNLIEVGCMMGICIDAPLVVLEEIPRFRYSPPVVRVENMLDQVKSKIFDPPQFILCLLPERKNCLVYGPWKKKCLFDGGIATQCIVPTTRINNQYLTNVMLKINAKLGGLNSMLAIEYSCNIPIVSKTPTMIFGMHVSHGSPRQFDVPSIAAVVGSRQWPCISRYRASVRTQSSKVEMIDSLFEKVSATGDKGIVRELLLEFFKSSQKMKPEQIIIFRDGVSESQFNQVLNIELDQIIQACKCLDDKWSPKFVVIVAQKNHHTKFFHHGNSPDNVPPGTIIDNEICHPRNNDFYLCAHAGMIGTSKPTYYQVLYDEVGVSPDDLQELVHNLSYVYQRSTTAVSVVAPVRYAHLAAAQMGRLIKFEDASVTSSSHGGVTLPGAVSVPPLPELHRDMQNSMFFC